MNELYQRTQLLVGPERMQRIRDARVILFGVGGVGGWCAEALVRSGIGHLTLVDADVVCPSNLNRQLPATTATLGRPKVDVLRERLLKINPDADITVRQERYSDDNYLSFNLEGYDYILDAIDALSDKASLILRACATPATFFSSMGAALKTDPTKVRVAEFFEVRGCPLGAALRKKLRRAGTLPAKPFLCVYDEEVLSNLGESSSDGSMTYGKASVNGTLAPVVGIFGFTLAGLVLQDLYQKTDSSLRAE